MTIKKTMAYLLSTVLLVMTLVPCLSAYAADTEYSDRVYQSVLKVSGTQKDVYRPEDQITLTLSVSSADGSAYGIRLYDNLISIEDDYFDIVSVNAGAGMNALIETDFEPQAGDNIHKIKWLYQAEPTGTKTEELILGTITLKVKDSAQSGEAKISQKLEGISDFDKKVPQTVTANPLEITIKDMNPDFRFVLETEGGLKSSYVPGEQLTVHAYITSSAVNFGAQTAVTNICFDPTVFELKSFQEKDGVTANKDGISGTDRALKMVYNKEKTTSKLEFCTFTLEVKSDAGSGSYEIRQEDAALQSGNMDIKNKSVDRLNIKVAMAGSAVFDLTIPNKKDVYQTGEEISFDLTIRTEGSFEPRMAGAEILYDTSVFSFKSAAGSGDKVDVAAKEEGIVLFAYYDLNHAAANGELKLGSFTLTVKESARNGATQLVQNDVNLSVGQHADEYSDLTAESVTVSIGPLPSISLTGNIAISGNTVFGQTLEADVSKIGPVGATYELNWYRGTEAAPIAAGTTYTVTKEDIGKNLTLKAEGTGLYSGEVKAETAVITKAAGPVAPAAPELAENGAGVTSITLKAVNGQEYRLGQSGTWQDSSTFTGLERGTSYTFYTRIKETETHLSGAVSTQGTFTTLQEGLELDQIGTVSMGTVKEGYTTVSAVTVTITNSGSAAVSGLRAALSGEQAESFSLTQPERTGLNAGETTTFTVEPRSGLAVGSHKATVTVTEASGLSAAFEVSFEVTGELPPEPTGVTVSGTVSVLSHPQLAEAILTTRDIADATAAYGFVVNEKDGDMVVKVKEDGSYAFDGIAEGTYNVLIRREGFTYAQLNHVVVGDTNRSLQELTLLAGDLNEDGEINASDLGMMIGGATYNKPVSGDGAAAYPAADLNQDGEVNASDYGIIIGAAYYNKTAMVLQDK